MTILCIINEKRGIFGTALIAKNWETIVKRKEYIPYSKNVSVIIDLAYSCKLFCPDIILDNEILKMKFSNDNRYLVFFFDKNNTINVSIGELDKERLDLEWPKDCNMGIFSQFLYE